MFDFLKKLFGKKTESAGKTSDKEAYPYPVREEERWKVQSVNRSSYVGYHPADNPPGAREDSQRPAAQQRPVIPQEQPAQIKPSAPEKPPVQQKPSEQPKPPVQPKQTVPQRPAGQPAESRKVYDLAWQGKSAETSRPRPAKVPADPGKQESPAAGSVRSSSQRKVVAPRSQGRAEVSPANRIQKTSVYIGLDFGTTFTKAAYEIAPSSVHTKYSIKFGRSASKEAYYLPSVLYFDPDANRLKISDTTDNCEVIRYFKYSIISEALQKNEVLNAPSVVTRANKEQLCCVYFLSHVIHLVRNAVYKNLERTKDPEHTSWYINMGVPLEAHKNDLRAALYKHVLEVAFLFEQKYHGLKEIDIHELDEFYMQHAEESNPNINILPEIYAEVLLYQQYLNTPAGFYTVVDIGGGTEDIATFLKMTDRYGEKVDCLAQNVISYGYDSIAEKIVRSINEESVRKAKGLLSQSVDFNSDELLRQAVPKEVNYDEVIDARRECRTLFGSCVQRARKVNPEILEQTVKANLPMHVFVMGGASSVEFYRSSIEYMKKVQANAGIPFFRDADVFDYIGRNTKLEIRNDQRLVISQMLAQPFEMIPEINNMPWNLKEKDLTPKGMNWLALEERLSELYSD